MKKIATFFAFGLIAATFVACGSPAEVHTSEKGEGALIGATASSPEAEDGNSRTMMME